MLYKLYKNVFKEPPPPERRMLFAKLYRKFRVELIGVWQNKNNPLEYYMLTKYDDEEHYNHFVTEAQKIPEYIRMNRIIDEIRISSEVVDLEETV